MTPIDIKKVEAAVKRNKAKKALLEALLNKKPRPGKTELHVDEVISLQQYLFLTSPFRYHWFCAGIGTGKSYILARYMVNRAVNNWETVGLVAANTYQQLTQSTLPHLFSLLDELQIDYVVNCRPPKSWKPRSLFKKGYEGIISIKVGVGKVAHILTRTLENFKAIRGVTIGWAGIDEVADTIIDAWKEINERLRCELSHALQIRVVGMPALPGDNWTWEVFNPSDPETQKMFRVTFQASTEALHLSWEEYLLPLLRTLDPRQAMQRIFARIVIDQAGRVYYCYQDGLNNVKKYDYDPAKELFLNFDFNILSSAPISACIFQEHDNGQGGYDVQVIDEISLPGMTTLEACYEFLARYEKHLGKIYVFGDATGNLNRTVTEFQHIKNVLIPKFGTHRVIIPDLRSNPDVNMRVAAVNSKLRNSFGEPSLFIDPDKCPELIMDFKKLLPKDGVEGKIDKSDNQRSHMSDALGYGIFVRFPPYDQSPMRARTKVNI